MSSNQVTQSLSPEDVQRLIAAYQTQQELLTRLQKKVDLQEARSVAQAEAVVVQSKPRVNFKPVKPNTFHGNNRATVDAWTFEMEQYFVVTGMEEKDKVPFAGAFLRDMASLWWRSVCQSREVTAIPLNWQDFKQLLTKRFQPVAATKTARAILASLKQNKSVAEYCNIFFRQMQLIDDMNPADQIERFVRGLKPPIANEVDMHDPKNLDEAMNLAQRAEIRRNNYYRPFQFKGNNQQHQGNPFSSNRFTSSYSGSTPMELGNTELEQDQESSLLLESIEDGYVNSINDSRISKNGGIKFRVPSLSKQEYDQLSKEGRCFKCRKPGHLARNCKVTNANQSKNY